MDKNVLSVLETRCPQVPRILVVTQIDLGSMHVRQHKNCVEGGRFRAAVLTSSMTNKGLAELFEKAQSCVATPQRLRIKEPVGINPMPHSLIKVQEKKPPRNTALGPRASSQYNSTPFVSTPPQVPTQRPETFDSRYGGGSYNSTPRLATPQSMHFTSSPFSYQPQDISQSVPPPSSGSGLSPRRLASSLSARAHRHRTPSEPNAREGRRCALQ